MKPDLQEFRRAALRYDAGDPLADFRKAFAGIGEELIYLDGNSLGPLPEKAGCDLERAVKDQWGRRLIRSWNEDWYQLPEVTGDALAPLIGAERGEVVFADSVTVNLFKLASAALKARPDRKTILTDDLNFPSDYYVLDGLIEALGDGRRMDVVPTENRDPSEAVKAAFGSDCALVTLSHVAFKSGYLHDLQGIAGRARENGALVLADLSHSVGSVPMELGRWGVDLAVGCSYKYLNGGPGGPAFLYVRKDLQDTLQPMLQGWFGTRDPFAFDRSYEPASGIRKFLTGTPPILSLKAVGAGIELLREAGMSRLRKKSLHQTGFLMQMAEEILEPLEFRLASPVDPDRRGSHIAMRHRDARRIARCLIEAPPGEPVIIPDFREPDNLRLGIAPLYVRDIDLVRTVERLADIVRSGEYQRIDHDTSPVT